MSEMLRPDVFTRRAPWRVTVDIKDLLTADDSAEGAREAARGIAERLSARVPSCPVIAAFAGVRSCAGLNRVLDRLYDWADAERVWLG